MKPFTVNRDSWHYKLNMHFANAYGDNVYYIRDRWEPKHNNFCSYWRATILRMFWVTVLATGIMGFFVMLGGAAYHNPAEFGIVIAGAITVFAAAFGSTFMINHIKNGLNNRTEKPDSLFAMKYKSYKAKVCPSVEFSK